MKVIITGSNGNLGSHIKEHADFETISFSRDDWVNIDETFSHSANSIIHTAYDLKKSIYDNPDEVLSSNVISTVHFLKKCFEFKINNFIFISSCSVYGDSTNTSEDSKCTPITVNGLTKLLNEKIIIEFCIKHNINYSILRVFNSYGGNDTFSVVSKLLKSASTGSPFTLYNNGQAERDFIHIDDVAQIICKLVNKNIKNEIINIGTGENIKIMNLVSEIEKKYGPMNIINDSSENEIKSSHANIRKLNEIMDYEFATILQHIRGL